MIIHSNLCGMNEITKLRERAKCKYETIVANSNAEYDATILRIAQLEQQLLGKDSIRALCGVGHSCGPSVRSGNILANLETVAPAHNWPKHSLVSHIFRFRLTGLIRRQRQHKNKGAQPALCARTDLEMPKLSFEGQTMLEVVQAVLVRPMTATRIAAAMLEQGYESTLKPQTLRGVVR